MFKPRSDRVIFSLLLGSTLLPIHLHAQDLVRDDLLTNSSQTSPWQQCATDSLAIDVSSLESRDCAYRTTPATAGLNYRMTCGVKVTEYASITLAFLDAQDNTLATRSTQVTINQSGANSVSLTSPENTATAAIGIYGEPGSGFQDCVLIDGAPAPEPTKGSISGGTWFDKNGDSIVDSNEGYIAGSPITLYYEGKVFRQATTGSDGTYYFGNLDIDACYTITFGASDSTLVGGPPGGDNDAISAGSTGNICLTEAEPNIIDCDSSFVPTEPTEPPADYAICGVSWTDSNSNGVFDATDSVLANVTVTVLEESTGNTLEVETDENGNYAINQLAQGNYSVQFETPDGYEITASATQPGEFSSYIADNGSTSVFNLPTDSNSSDESACTIKYINAGYTKLPVALEPTVAEDDYASHETGEDFSIDVLANDSPCENTVYEVDLLGHNVPGKVVFDTSSQTFKVSDTTESGSYNIEYGLRGSCGSYDTATVVIDILEPEPPVTATAPTAPICRVETGGSVVYGGVDVFNVDADGFSSQYNMYDRDKNLVITVDSNDYTAKVFIGNTTNRWIIDYQNSYEIEWNGTNYGYDQVSIYYVSAVENGEESALTECVRSLVSPIALDLFNEGRIQRVTGSFEVDLNSDGFKEALNEWFAPNAGILVSKGASGQISGEHLFGNVHGVYANGFEELATLDTNEDDALSGEELKGLEIWTDLNSNTRVDRGEISSLQDHHIVSLSLKHYKYLSRASKSNGRSILMEDVWLPLSPMANLSD